MARALVLAHTGMAAGEPPFGVVIVDARGHEVSASHDCVNRDGDMTSHAEVLAIRLACRERGPSLEGCTLYTTCEPCPMCYTAAWLARIDTIVYAVTMDEVHAILGDAQRELRVPIDRINAMSPQPLTLVAGVLRDQSLELFHRWARKAAS